MREVNFLQLQSHVLHSQQTQDTGLSAINMEVIFKTLTDLVQRIEHKIDLFNMRMEMVEKSLEKLRSKCLVGAPSKQPSNPSLLPPSPSLEQLKLIQYAFDIDV